MKTEKKERNMQQIHKDDEYSLSLSSYTGILSFLYWLDALIHRSTSSYAILRHASLFILLTWLSSWKLCC